MGTQGTHTSNQNNNVVDSFAHILNSPSGRRLVVAYMLVRGGNAVNDSSVTLRGYHVENGSFHLAASTGSDLDGHGLFVRELQSSVPQERWILAWGPRSGFNGNKVRMRIYAYNGNSFRTVWSPPDTLNATISTSIDHLDENRYFVTQHPPYYLRNEYTLTPDGVRLIASHYFPE